MNKQKSWESAISFTEVILKRWKELEAAVRDAKARAGGHTGGSAGHAFVPDPTANAAVRLADGIGRVTLSDGFYVNQPEKWLHAIQLSYERGDYFVREIVRRRYLLRESHTQTVTELPISDRSYYSLLEDFRTAVTMAAVQEGLLKVF